MTRTIDHSSRIQAYLHHKTRSRREVIALAPFTLYLQMGAQRSDESVAIPSERVAQLGTGVTEAIEQFFVRRDQTPCFQYLDGYSPMLGSALQEIGYTYQERLPLLFCRPGQIQAPTIAPPLDYVVSSSQSAPEEVAEGWNVNARGFDPSAAPGTRDEIEAFRQSLITARSFTARWNGQGVAAGMFMEIEEGVTEVAGITTLEPFRRCGIASALTAYITQAAFEQGATLTFLIAASPAASRVYQRVGYRYCGNLVTFVKQADTRSLVWDSLW